MMKNTLTSTLMTLLFISCVSMKTDEKVVDIDTFAAMVENSFSTAEANTQNIIQDRRIRIHSTDLDGYWFYTQLNTGAQGKLYRQRVSHLTLSGDRKAIIQKTYGLKKPELYENAWEDLERLNRLTPNDFESYFQAGCEQIWTPRENGAWVGHVDPQTCVVSSKRRNKDIRIESEAYLSKDIYRTNERGYEMDMIFLWGTKPGEYIDLFPVP